MSENRPRLQLVTLRLTIEDVQVIYNALYTHSAVPLASEDKEYRERTETLLTKFEELL